MPLEMSAGGRLCLSTNAVRVKIRGLLEDPLFQGLRDKLRESRDWAAGVEVAVDVRRWVASVRKSSTPPELRDAEQIRDEADQLIEAIDTLIDQLNRVRSAAEITLYQAELSSARLHRRWMADARQYQSTIDPGDLHPQQPVDG